MAWNWQHEDWPNFTYHVSKIAAFEREFLRKAGEEYGSLKHICDEDHEELKVDLISLEALKSSEIEGEILNRESLYSSIGRQFGLKLDNRRVSPSEYGVSEMMVYLYKNHDTALSHHELFTWHEMLTNGRRDLIDIGRYRTHEEPMQIVSGILNKPKVYFEAPPSKHIQNQMEQFISWFNTQGGHLGALERSAIAHLHFESIHPFEDGNGRIGRAISEKALSQSLGRPTLIAISYTIEAAKKEYYEALHHYSTGLEITGWLEYFCKMVLKAQDYTQQMIDFLIEKGKFYQRFEKQLNDRQMKIVQRIFKEGLTGFKGGLSAKNYIAITKSTASTATRDLQKMVEIGALKRTGERKSTRYFLNINERTLT